MSLQAGKERSARVMHQLDERLLALTFPVACAGNLDGEPKDWCALDAEAVIEDALKNEARKKLEKKAGKLLNKLFDED